MKEKIEKLAELLKTDESLAKELFSIKDAADAQKWISEHGIDMTLDEVILLGEHMKKLKSASSEDVELSDEEMMQVAGGYELPDINDAELTDVVVGGLKNIWKYLTGWW